MLKRGGGERCLPHCSKNLRDLILASTSCTLQDCLQCKASRMKPISETIAQKRPNPSTQRPKSEIPSNAMLGFPVSTNKFNVLQESESAVSTNQVQDEDSLVNPGSTRLQKLQATRRAEEQETLLTEGIFETIAHWNNDEQEIVPSGDCVEPVSSGTHPAFIHSLSVSPTDILSAQSVGNQNFELGTGDCDDAIYISNVNDVDCTNTIYNKRISYAGQDWSTGQPGNRPIGASDATRNSQTCLGPSTTRESRQSPYMGHNTRDSIEASSRQPDQKIKTLVIPQQVFQ